LETVAVGFSASGRYFGPRPCSGAGEETPLCVLAAIIGKEGLSSSLVNRTVLSILVTAGVSADEIEYCSLIKEQHERLGGMIGEMCLR
jgi:hypothetical protein